ncbi:MAG: NADP oxidoreductase [Chloroflexi bacterium]|nr:MAG: NADP oxidoreductase [Chloroflexota bacterium]
MPDHLPGSQAGHPLRVAVVGSGPAGFYAAEHLLKQPGLHVVLDMYEMLPMPFGLVRYGVAPDHQKIKSVTKAFESVASRPNFRLLGNVEVGRHITTQELQNYYHQIVFTVGAQSDRRLGIPGEDLIGSHPATHFVAWYNGHPLFRDYQFDLTQECVAIVGVGNVAIDVARILCRTRAELARTDIADYALAALSASKVREVYLLGRRGPAQAAFSNPEIKELGEMEGADPIVLPAEAALDELSTQELLTTPDKTARRKVELLQAYATRAPTGKARRLNLRFLVSPVELLGNAAGQVAGLRIVRNVLQKNAAGALQPVATDAFETLPAGLVFRSVGYRGTPLAGVPFADRAGVILNSLGRILDPQTQVPVAGHYTAGWIKRGPSGVIGTNKPDAVETVVCMLADREAGVLLQPAHPQIDAVDALLQERQPQLVTYADWQQLDKKEQILGAASGRPRVKFTSMPEVVAALGRSS